MLPVRAESVGSLQKQERATKLDSPITDGKSVLLPVDATAVVAALTGNGAAIGPKVSNAINNSVLALGLDGPPDFREMGVPAGHVDKVAKASSEVPVGAKLSRR